MEQSQPDIGAGKPARPPPAGHEPVRANFFGLDCEPEVDDPRAKVIGRALDRGWIFRASTSRQRFLRDPALVDCSAADTAIVAFVMGGTYTVNQGTCASVLNCGDLCILDASRPFDATMMSDEVEHGIIRVSKSQITRRIGGANELAFGTFGCDRPLQRLTTTFATSVIGSLEQFETDTLDMLLGQVLDLLALMIAHEARGVVEPSTHRAGLLHRVKSHIAAHLRDADLTIETTGAAIGISSRYVNALLASEGTSFGRYVLAKRLAGARREIHDPRLVHAQITEVAFGWGFNNASHFGRVFKDRYGVTPSEAKAEARIASTGRVQ